MFSFTISIVEKIENQLKENGVILKPNSSIKSAKDTNDSVEIIFDDNKVLKTQMLLVATGRVPNTDVIKTAKIKTGGKPPSARP